MTAITYTEGTDSTDQLELAVRRALTEMKTDRSIGVYVDEGVCQEQLDVDDFRDIPGSHWVDVVFEGWTDNVYYIADYVANEMTQDSESDFYGYEPLVMRGRDEIRVTFTRAWV